MALSSRFASTLVDCRSSSSSMLLARSFSRAATSTSNFFGTNILNKRCFSSLSSSSSSKKKVASLDSLREVATKVKNYKKSGAASLTSTISSPKASPSRKEETSLERVTDLNAQGFEYMRVKMYAEAENNFREAIMLLPSVRLASSPPSPHSTEANSTVALDQIVDDPEVALLGASLLNNLGMACAEQFFTLDPKLQQAQREQRLRRLAAQHKETQLKLRVKLQKRKNKDQGEGGVEKEADAKRGDVSSSNNSSNSSNSVVSKEEELNEEDDHHEESLSKFDEAVEFLQEALDIRTVQRGLLHTETLTVLSNLGLLFQKQKDYHTALSYYEKASDALDELLKCLEELEAKVYNNQVHVAAKSPKHTRSTKAIDSVLGEHKATINEEEIAASLADIDLVSLEDQLVKARKLQAVVLNNAAVSFCKLADMADKEMQEIQDHKDAAQRAQQKQQSGVDAQDSSSEDFHENERESYESDAIRCWKKSLELFERKGSLKLAADALNTDYVTALRNLGALYLKRKELDQSSSLFERLLNLQQEEFGNSNAKLIPTLASLSDISLSRYNQSKDMADLTKAKSLMQRAFDLETIHLPDRKANSNLKKKLSELEKMIRAK